METQRAWERERDSTRDLVSKVTSSGIWVMRVVPTGGCELDERKKVELKRGAKVENLLSNDGW